MRRTIIAAAVLAVALIPGAIGSLRPGYAQTTAGPPQGDEFDSSTFTAPFHAVCAPLATSPCPDPQSNTTWNLNSQTPGQLRIWTQFGSLLGGASQSSNNARDLILQPVAPATDWTVTTQMTFPATVVNVNSLDQTAGLIVYQDPDNFIFVGRTFSSSGVPQLEFVQEAAGVDLTRTVPESALLQPTVFLRLTKTGSLYQASYSYDNATFTPISPQVAPAPTATATSTATIAPTATATVSPTATTTPVSTSTATLTPTATNTPAPTATSTPGPTGYTATYASPQLGLFAWGGTNATVNANMIPADFNWFRVGNSQVPGATATATATNTAGPTSTSTATATSTAAATSTSTPAPTATSTPIPTPTPLPKPKYVLAFKRVSVWYHVVRQGTWNYLDVQANHKQTLGIWVHVIFPSGLHYDFYQNTNSSGRWTQRFNVPTGAKSPNWNQATITLQLWHAKKTVKDFEFFTVV